MIYSVVDHSLHLHAAVDDGTLPKAYSAGLEGEKEGTAAKVHRLIPSCNNCSGAVTVIDSFQNRAPRSYIYSLRIRS